MSCETFWVTWNWIRFWLRSIGMLRKWLNVMSKKVFNIFITLRLSTNMSLYMAINHDKAENIIESFCQKMISVTFGIILKFDCVFLKIRKWQISKYCSIMSCKILWTSWNYDWFFSRSARDLRKRSNVTPYFSNFCIQQGFTRAHLKGLYKNMPYSEAALLPT